MTLHQRREDTFTEATSTTVLAAVTVLIGTIVGATAAYLIWIVWL